MEIHERAMGVKSRSDLADFVRYLADDLKTDPDSWENPTLESYLEALARWIADAEGFYRNTGQKVPAQPLWRNVADMLIAAKVYE